MTINKQTANHHQQHVWEQQQTIRSLSRATVLKQAACPCSPGFANTLFISSTRPPYIVPDCLPLTSKTPPLENSRGATQLTVGPHDRLDVPILNCTRYSPLSELRFSQRESPTVPAIGSAGRQYQWHYARAGAWSGQAHAMTGGT